LQEFLAALGRGPANRVPIEQKTKRNWLPTASFGAISGFGYFCRRSRSSRAKWAINRAN